jgi:hypothetical protein
MKYAPAIVLCLILGAAPHQAVSAVAGSAPMTDHQMEQFLGEAEVVKTKSLSVGVTNSKRATLSLGGLTHDAHVQTIDEFKQRFEGGRSVEINFRDSYRYNIAAYRLDRLIGLNIIPVSVERKIAGRTASVTWWMDDIAMMELDRHKKKIQVPNPDDWNDQMYQVRVFNQLVYNMDPNLGNVLITHDWKIRLVDFTRAFRWQTDLKDSKDLVRIDRRVYNGLRELTDEKLAAAMGPLLMKPEQQGVLARRDKILEFFNAKIAKEGEAAVICDGAGH